MPLTKRNIKPRFRIDEWNLRSSADQSTQKLARKFSSQPRHSLKVFLNIARSHGFTASEAMKLWQKTQK
ncbi:MAG: hypothetical protein ABH986_00600 [archaeon]